MVHLRRPAAEVESFGAVVPPLAVVKEDYWGFEKIGELLPLDYQPPRLPHRRRRRSPRADVIFGPNAGSAPPKSHP